MKPRAPAHAKTGTLIAGCAVLLILLPLGYSLVHRVMAEPTPAGEPFYERPADQYQECVRETSYMRYHHMDLLAEIRDRVVREGERPEVSLANCRECHPSRERFCNRCHDAVNLAPDCFGCHYWPEPTSEFTGEEDDG